MSTTCHEAPLNATDECARAPTPHPRFGCTVFWVWYLASWVIGFSAAGHRAGTLLSVPDGRQNWVLGILDCLWTFFSWMFAWQFHVSLWSGPFVTSLVAAAFIDLATIRR